MSEPLAAPPRGYRRPSLAVHLAALAVLLLTAGALRGVLIARAEVIARDGTRYTQMARQWPIDPRGVINDNDYHVGYPALVAAAHRAARPWLPEGLEGWHLAGQAVSLLAGLAAVGAMYLLAIRVIGWPAGWMSTLLWAVGRKWAALGADVLSDAASVAFQLWALLLGVWVLARLRRRRWHGGLALAFAAGTLGGAGYLVRPDALASVLVVLILLAALAVRHRDKIGRCALAGVCCLVGTALAAGPYMIAIGGISRKKSLSDIVHAVPAGGSFVPAGLLTSGDYFVLRQMVNMLFEAMHPAVGFLALIYLVSRALGRLRRPPAIARPPRLGRDGRWLLPACLLVYALMAGGLYLNVGYLSHRHVMALGSILSPLAGGGLMVLAGWLALAIRRSTPRDHRRIAWTLLAVIAAAVVALHSIDPPHEGKAYHRRAGVWLRQHRPPELPFLLTDSPWALHYSQWPGHQLGDHESTSKAVLALAADRQATHVVIDRRSIAKAMPQLPIALQDAGYIPIREFPSVRRPERRGLLVFARSHPGRESASPPPR
jgi:hypothetical protein